MTAPFHHGALGGTATVSILNTYKSGHVTITVTGVKKGDHLVGSLHFRTKKGKTGTIATTGSKTTTAAGSATFSFTLTSAERSRIKADLKAGDTLKIRFTDGTVTATGTFRKV